MLNRRDFLKIIAGAGITIGFPSYLNAFQGLIRDLGKPQTEQKIEVPTYYLNDGKFFYLIGNPEDRDFIKSRELILSTDPFYLWSIAITDSNTLPFKPEREESVILLPEDVSSHRCDTLIRDLRLLLHPGQFIGIDYADIQTALGGSTARHLFVEGDQDSFGRSLCDLASKNKSAFESCNRLLMVFSGRLDCMNLRAIHEYSTFISSSVDPDAFIVYAAYYHETWKTEYSVSLIMS